MASSDGLSTPTAAPGLEYYQCSQCQRSYSRVDHLARHVRSHLQQKPFECTVCNKGFGRPDVLKRHALSHEPDANDPKRQKRHFGQSSRVAQACKACATAKLKCEDEKPCRRCRHKGIQCDYGADVRFPGPYPSDADGQSILPHMSEPSGSYQKDFTRVTTSQSSDILTPETEAQEVSEPPIMRPAEVATQAAIMHEGDFSDFLRDIVMPPQLDPVSHAAHSMNWAQQQDCWPRDVLNFTIDGGLELESMDLGMIDALSGLKSSTSYPNPHIEVDDSEVAKHYAALGFEAFERSPVSRWKPGPGDNLYIGQQNLALPEGTHARMRIDRTLQSEHLDVRARDALLALVLAHCEPANVPRVVASFPTTALLEDLVQRFIQHHGPRIGSWIHVASFQASHERAELLCAIVSAGAILMGSRALRKFGFALHEALRLAIPKRCEENNSLTRELWMLQSLMFDLDIGLWSGNQRKMELSESAGQIIVTMMRRGGKFQRSKSAPVVPLPQDTGEVLNSKWRQWIEQESLKRVVFHAFIYTSQASVSLLVPPVITYSEISLLLPAAQDLWTAENAEKWKQIYLSRPMPSPDLMISSLDAIREPTALVSIQQACDLQFSSLIVLHGLWGMVWEYIQMATIIKTKPEHSNGALIMKSRHQELCQILVNFRMSMSEWIVEPSNEVLLIFDLLLMYLHMSLEEIQLFAGKEGKDEARRVFPLLQQWINSSSSREAMWHAAQVLRRARSFTPNSLRDFYAIAVYHASIAFWAFGIISKIKPLSNQDSLTGIAELAAANPYVLLDGEGMTDIQRFISLGRGIPSISSRPKIDTTQLVSVPLTDPELIMEAAINTLRQNYAGHAENDLLPPMVENLVRLMRGLENAARGLRR